MRYSFTIDSVEYDAYKDGTPFTLADCWREVHGVGNARIWCGDRLVLDRAGESTMRRHRIRERFEQARQERRRRYLESLAALDGRRARTVAA